MCISRLHDVQLGVVIARLFEGEPEGGPNYNRILDEVILGKAKNKTPENKGMVFHLLCKLLSQTAFFGCGISVLRNP